MDGIRVLVLFGGFFRWGFGFCGGLKEPRPHKVTGSGCRGWEEEICGSRRSVELKHGRIAMLATMGVLL